MPTTLTALIPWLIKAGIIAVVFFIVWLLLERFVLPAFPPVARQIAMLVMALFALIVIASQLFGVAL